MSNQAVRIGDWELDRALNEIRRPGASIRLEPKVVDVLAYLADRPGSVVSRDELLEAVWPGVVVGDDALTQAVIKLRKALGDEARQPAYIETIAKRGYRLLAPVANGAGGDAATVSGSRLPVAVTVFRRWRWTAAIGLAIAVALAVLAARMVAAPWPLGGDAPGHAAADPPTVVVLPLANLSGDAGRDYFTDGMTEDVIDALGRFSGLRVLSRGAVAPFASRAATPSEMGRALGVKYVVSGSVRHADGRLRVSCELVDARDGRVLWSERYEGSGGDVLDLQDRLVRDLVGPLAIRVETQERQRRSGRPAAGLEAYDLVLRARALIHRGTRETNRQARELLAQAVKLAPDYGDAWVALAHAEYRRADQGWMQDAEEGLRRVEAHARRALELPDRGAHARAHAYLARVLGQRRDLPTALAEAVKGVAINPSDPVALYAEGSTRIWLGEFERGTAILESATRFDPTLDDILSPAGYFLQKRYREALARAEERIARTPEIPVLHAVRAAALVRLDRPADAELAAAEVKRLSPFARVEGFVPTLSPEQLADLRDALRQAGL